MGTQQRSGARPAFFVGLSPLTILIFFPFILMFGLIYILAKFIYFVGLAIVLAVRNHRDAQPDISE